MNSVDYIGLRPRNMAYLANIYSSYTEINEEYTEDELILQINLTYGMMHKSELDNKDIREYYIQDNEGKKYVKNLKIIEINMDYIMNLWDNNEKKEIEKYKYLIMLDLNEKELKKLSKDKVVEEYMNKLNSINNDPIFKKLMTDEEDRKKYENTIKRNAKDEGIIEEKINIVKEMLNKKLDIKLISEITSLSIEDINLLKKQL